MGHIEQVLRISRAHGGLHGGQELDVARPPPGFLFNLPGCRDRWIFVWIDIAAWEFPYPAIDDEAVPPHHQDFVVLVEHDHHGGPGHTQYVLFELHPVRQLDRCDGQPRPSTVIDDALTVDRPARRILYIPIGGHVGEPTLRPCDGAYHERSFSGHE